MLTVTGMVLSKPFDWLELHLPEWLFKPLIGCSKCVAGQWALWLFPFYIADKYDVIVHAWFVLQCIFNAVIVRALYYKITESATQERAKKYPLPPELLTKK